MASFILEDPTGSIEVLVFPNLYERVAVEADNDRVVVVKGRLDAAEEGEKLLAQQIRWL
jgi:DNA polymerase-3 subunit alpha